MLMMTFDVDVDESMNHGRGFMSFPYKYVDKRKRGGLKCCRCRRVRPACRVVSCPRSLRSASFVVVKS